jgi:hypothetical protein
MSLGRLVATATLGVAIAAWPAVARARISSLAAGGARLFALDENAVVILDDGGHPVGRCARLAAPAARAPSAPPSPAPATRDRAGIGAPEPEDVLRAVGLPVDDLDSSAAEAVLDAAGLRPLRRHRLPATEPVVELRGLAADPATDDVWIATSAGLYRGRADGCTPWALSGRELRLVAAGADLVAATTEGLLWRFDAATGGLAGVTGLASPPRALAIARDGHALVAGAEGLLSIDPGGRADRLIDEPVDAIVACGDRNAALADDGVYVWRNGERPARTAARPPARTLACGPTPETPWLAAGVGLWGSPDGVAWSDLPGWRGLSIASVVAIHGRVWVASDGVLRQVDAAPQDAPAGSRAALPPLSTGERDLLALVPWPQVALVAAGQRTETRSGWSAVLLLTFPVGGRGPRRAPVSTERARRDAALAAEEAFLTGPAPAQDDERAARLRLVKREREALR